MNKRTLLLKAPLRGYAAGTKVEIKVDKHGTPLDRYWRDRLRDAKTDNCVEFVDTKKSAKSTDKTEVRNNAH